MSYFLDHTGLQKEMQAGLKIIDVRSEADFQTGHLMGAIHFDMKKDFTGETNFFPEVNHLVDKLSANGIANDMPIVIYDDGSNRNAAKAWVVLHYLGHEKIQILQGGFAAWVGDHLPVTTDVAQYEPVDYLPNVKVEVAVDIEEMQGKLQGDHSTLIDSRANERFTGEREPSYEKAGHIPGAVNYVTKEVFSQDGKWHDKEQLANHFKSIDNEKEVVVSCGTGTSACMNFVALKEAGKKNVKIFPGGFKQWIDHGHDIETGE